MLLLKMFSFLEVLLLRENYNIPNIDLFKIKKIKSRYRKAVDERVAKEATASDVDEETSSTDSKSEIVKVIHVSKTIIYCQMLADISD